MSLPSNQASSISFGGLFYPPDDRVTTPIVDYEMGGIALLDTSMGLNYRPWRVRLDNYEVKLMPDGGEEVVIFEGTQITELSLCFDQNMRYSVGYVQDGLLKLNWFDSVAGTRVVTVFAVAVNPKMTLDDKRPMEVATSDMILAYIRGNALYYRQQRDRFLIERMLRGSLFPGTKLKNIGMNKNMRLQFELV